MQYNYQNEPTPEDQDMKDLEEIDDLDDEEFNKVDFSKYWSDYDTWGYDKRALGSMKRKKASEPLNQMRKRADEKRALGSMKRKKAGQPLNEMRKRDDKRALGSMKRKK